MIVNRSHLSWALFVLFASGFCTLLYLANYHPHALPVRLPLPAWFGPVPPVRNSVGGTPYGLVLGSLALAIFVFASALGIRKKRRLWPIGNVQLWLKAHIWLTVLTIPLVLLHSGIRHGGPMTTTLLLLYIVVMASGFFGLGMQQFMPRLMHARLPREIVFEEIPYVKKSLVDSAEALRRSLEPAESKVEAAAVAAGSDSPAGAHAPATIVALAPRQDHTEQLIKEFLDADCLPYLRSHRGRGLRLENQKSAENVFRLLKLGIEPKWWDTIEEMQLWCDERRQMDLQVSLHHWLHGWLLIHVPLSFALLVLTFWHAYVTAIYL